MPGMNSPAMPPIESVSEGEWAAPSTNVQAEVIGLVGAHRQLKQMISKLESAYYSTRARASTAHAPPSDSITISGLISISAMVG
jgi:hypothetical protein